MDFLLNGESGDPETVSDMGLIGSEMPESGKW